MFCCRSCQSIIKVPFVFNSFRRSFFTRNSFAPRVENFSRQDVFSCNVKLNRLFQAGNLDAARQLFDEMPKKDVVSWNTAVTGYWQHGFPDESRKLFELIPERNVVSWNSMIAGCVENEMIDEAFEYFRAMPVKNTASWNAMLSGLVRFDKIEEARSLFEEIPSRNVISYTAMIDGYMKIGEMEKATMLFDQMPCRNVVSWTVMIRGCADNGRIDEALELYEKMPDKNVVAMTALITGYCKEGRMNEARILFDGIQDKDRVSWNALITGYAQNGLGEEALKFVSDMMKVGLEPDHYTLVSAFTACSSLASLREGRQMHTLVVKEGFEFYRSVCNSLITMYSKCGSILDSEMAFGNIQNPDLVSWNTIIAAFAQHGLYKKAFYFFNQMELSGSRPDGITFLSLLSACAHAGRVSESMSLFDSMSKDYGICLSSEHYACLIDILCRAGLLEKACNIIRSMPSEVDSGIWGALLAACSLHLNIELGEIAAKHIMDLDPQNSGAYVLLSNMYAATGMWEKVTDVRVLMREKGVKKQKANSWLEMGNKVHLFLGGDVSHPDIDDIHRELKKMCSQMKALDDIDERIFFLSCS